MRLLSTLSPLFLFLIVLLLCYNFLYVCSSIFLSLSLSMNLFTRYLILFCYFVCLFLFFHLFIHCFCFWRKYFFLIKLKGFSLKSKNMFDPCHVCHLVKKIIATNLKCGANVLSENDLHFRTMLQCQQKTIVELQWNMN